MKYASEDLIHEHKGILEGIDILESMIEEINKGKSVDHSDLEEIVKFFRLFADKCHHGKEEKSLFPEMIKSGISSENSPIEQMFKEHKLGREYISSMTSALGNKKLNPDFVQAGKDYIELIRSHILKEDTILFPMGDKQIPGDKQSELLENFEKFEQEVMGEGIHEELHSLLGKLKNKY